VSLYGTGTAAPIAAFLMSEGLEQVFDEQKRQNCNFLRGTKLSRSIYYPKS